MASADSLECLSCRNTVNYKSYFNTSLILAQITNCERRHIVCCTAMNTEVNQSNKKRQGSPVVRVLASELEITPQICCATLNHPLISLHLGFLVVKIMRTLTLSYLCWKESLIKSQ